MKKLIVIVAITLLVGCGGLSTHKTVAEVNVCRDANLDFHVYINKFGSVANVACSNPEDRE